MRERLGGGKGGHSLKEEIKTLIQSPPSRKELTFPPAADEAPRSEGISLLLDLRD